MSKKSAPDSANPFLNIDKSRFAKDSGERDERSQTYARNKSLSKLTKKAQAEANSGNDDKAGDYFTSLMNMGGVAKMKASPKVSKAEIAKTASKLEVNAGLPREWPPQVSTDSLSTGELSAKEIDDPAEFLELMQQVYFAEPEVLPAKQSLPQPISNLKKESRPAQNLQAGTMSAMLANVAVKEGLTLDQEEEELSADKKQEEKLLGDYLAAAAKKPAGAKTVIFERQTSSLPTAHTALSTGNAATPSEFSGLAEFDPDNEVQAFSAAMQQVAPLAGKGRDVVPEPERPAGQITPENFLQDFMDGKVEFSLEFTDEYIEGHVLGLDPAIIGKMRAGSFSYEAHLDLHGLNAAQAFDSLVNFIRASYQRGRRSVLLIPGRGKNSPDGTGILRDKMQEWLTQDPMKRVVLAFCTALPKHGGPGALYVLLRKLKKSRGKIMWDRRPSDPDLFG